MITKIKGHHIKKTIQLVGTLLSTVLFFWLLSRQDWQSIMVNLKLLPVWIWPVCLLLVVTGMIFNALRWYLLLRVQKIKMPFFEIIKTVFAGAFASNFLPSTIGGDAFRIISLRRFTDDNIINTASVIVDRVINFIASLTFLPFSWIVFGKEIFEYVLPSNRFAPMLSSIPIVEKIYEKLSLYFDRFKKAISNWADHPYILFITFVISWVSILVVYIAVWLLAHFLGIPVTIIQVIGIAAIVYIVILLPVSFNGYGIREVIYITLYMQLGATLEQATTLALLSRFFMVIETVPGALWLTKIMSVEKNSSSSK